MKDDKSDYLRNPGFDDRFTCPRCYTDFYDRHARQCPTCGIPVRCRVDMEPVAVCELFTADEEETSR